MPLTPVLSQEEYIEQAYFFRACRERMAEGRPAQEVLEHLAQELLATTQLPHAVQFMIAELKHSGQLASAFRRLGHYFTGFQSHVISAAEAETARFSFEQALVILEREAEYRASGRAVPAGLFIYQLESISRNRLGYLDGMAGMLTDAFFDEAWREYIALVRSQLDIRDFAELIFARSEHYVTQRRRAEPKYQPPFQVLFSEKEGRIALANRGKDPTYLFATLQRQLGYPEVPRPSLPDTQKLLFDDLQKRLKVVETRVNLIDAQLTGDLSQFVVKPSAKPTGGKEGKDGKEGKGKRPAK